MFDPGSWRIIMVIGAVKPMDMADRTSAEICFANDLRSGAAIESARQVGFVEPNEYR
ncbi:hypothetical protein BGCPKDLD_2424 [Methylorubrum suomiense]|uniref:Uncharacterized protein n=1 Tax=Methylorubrum suomiense TaxID=144191 RepID=A0ABQ4UUD4_9HYPH|nr:hypothetical protein BGCPKDLD_2424 [Methylorubrum suomiense]